MKKVLIIICIISIISIGIFIVGQGEDVVTYAKSPYSGSIYENSDNQTYDNFLKDECIVRPQEEIVIDATLNYEYIDKDYDGEKEIKVDEYLNKKGLYLPETGDITYSVDVSKEGYYNIKIDYYTITGRSSNISKGLKINGEYQFTEAKNFVLPRTWQDEFDVASKRADGLHDLKPTQIEKMTWKTLPISNNEGYYNEPYLFFFEEGINTITLVSDHEPVVLRTISLYQERSINNYDEVLKEYTNKGYEKKSINLIEDKVQGEKSFEKSSPSLAPVASYTSFLIEPYAKFLTRYNTIGGVNWRIAGDYISWNVTVKEAGLYELTIKALQNYNRGQAASRVLKINDKIPFKECENICFNYASDWQNITLGNEQGAYLFYLNEGTNTITLQNTIGSYGESVKIVNQVIADLNWIYRKVIMRTGVSPSKYHDFQLKENIPDLYTKIETSISNLNFAINEVIRIAGERSDLIASLERTKYQLETFLENEKKIQTGLTELETNITSLGTWVTTVTSQPLSIDYLLIHGENAKLDKATTNFFQKLWHELIMLIGSYSNDTSLKSSLNVDGPTIVVWIMTGRDQSSLMRQLIDESFTLQNNINVDLKLVTGSVLLPATLSGNGPDVAIGVGQNIPVNWGIRNAVVDMSKLEGFDEFVQEFYPSAITPFTFNNATYALPDTQDFLVQYVRTDIFEEFNLVDEEGKTKVPTTWDEVIDLLPILQRQYLDYYLPNTTGSISPLMYAMICQYGGSLYLEDGALSGMMEKESANAFYDFVDFFRNYGFSVDANFTNRFRTGEMPIGVSNYTLYNTLSVSAPEIRGNWSFAPFPGAVMEDGTNSYATTSSSSGTIILADSEEINASWKFVKWWLGETAQTGYARGMEAILGAAARYPTANKKAFANLPWSAREYRLLEEERSLAYGIPTVPGDYIVGRYIDNAFRKILNDGINPSDSLFNYYQKINIELARKRQEFELE